MKDFLKWFGDMIFPLIVSFIGLLVLGTFLASFLAWECYIFLETLKFLTK